MVEGDVRRRVLLLLCAALGACANPGAGIEGSDSDSTFGGLRASWEVPRPMLTGGKPPPRQYLLQVELGSSDADDSQSLPAGDTLTVDGADFVGPTNVHIGYDLYQANVDARMRLRGGSFFGLDLFGGIGFARLELDASEIGASASRAEDGFGPRIGLGLFCEPQSRLRLYLDGSWQPTFVGGGDIADVQALDLGLDYRLTDSIEVGLAWRQLVYELEDDGADSDLDLEASGPRLSIALRL
jgi:opacity protein-like surface antigen